jgi:hypothetical protein
MQSSGYDAVDDLLSAVPTAFLGGVILLASAAVVPALGSAKPASEGGCASAQ